jgi:GH18 family chitinase
MKKSDGLFLFRLTVLLGVFLVAGISHAVGQVNTGGTATTLDHNKHVIGYITQWDPWKSTPAGVPSAGSLVHLNIDYSKYTILNYSFFGVAVDGSLHSGDYRNKQIYQPGTIQSPAPMIHTSIYDSWDQLLINGDGAGAPGLLTLAHQNGVKVMASIGGWSMCRHFPEMAADATKRAKFINDCKTLINMGFDGIDLDWEYPGPFAGMNFTGSQADFGNFLTLVQAIRNAIGPNKLITAAMSAAPSKMEGFNWQALAQTMDLFNFMTYDYNGGWSDKAGFNSPLDNYDGAEIADFNWTATYNKAVSLGIPKSKICMGVPFYGRGVICSGAATLNGATTKRNEFVQPDGPIVTCADYTNWPKEVYDGTPNFFFVEKNRAGWTEHWNAQAKSPYLTKGQYFLSYDNVQSVGEKAKFINDKGLAGVIIWTVMGDLQISGAGTPVGTNKKLVKYTQVQSPLVNKINEVFAGGGSGNPGPIVTITSPANGSTFTENISFTISATASDPGGSVARVEFYDGNTKIGEDTSSPYSISYSTAVIGDHQLKARAIDNLGAIGVSSVVNIVVELVGGGTCTAPQYVAGTSYNAGQDVKNNGTKYTCLVAGWCSSNAAWAYEPGIGTAWQSAWTAAGPCGGGGTNVAPSVNFTAPASGATINQGTSVMVSASASDTDGTISKVEFFVDGTSIGVDTSAPYSVTWSATPVGSRTLSVTATDNGNATATATRNVTVQGTGNTPPTTSILSPQNGATFTTGSTITVTASATDANGTITKVEFFNGSTSLGVDTSSPYSIVIAGAGAGTYSLRTVATDNGGAIGTSSIVTITVGTQGGCTAPQYVAGTKYNDGARVKNINKLYECKVGGWCSSTAAWAYAPGTGSAWTLAWTEIGPCATAARMVAAPEMVISEAKAFPNPFKDRLQLNIMVEEAQPIMLRLFTSTGTEIGAFITQNPVSGENRIIFDGKALPPGLYFYEVAIERKKTYTGKVYKISE